MLPKAHLTHIPGCLALGEWSHYRGYLGGSWRSFLCNSLVYSCYLFKIFSSSVRSMPFLSFIVPIFAWNVSFVLLQSVIKKISAPGAQFGQSGLLASHYKYLGFPKFVSLSCSASPLHLQHLSRLWNYVPWICRGRRGLAWTWSLFTLLCCEQYGLLFLIQESSASIHENSILSCDLANRLKP